MWRSRKREIKVTVDYVQRESDAESESAYMRVIYCDEAHLQQTRGIQWELNRHKLFSQHFYIYSAAANCILIFTAQLYHKLIHRAMLHENGKRRKFLNKTRHAGEEECITQKKIFLHISLHNMSSSKKARKLLRLCAFLRKMISISHPLYELKPFSFAWCLLWKFVCGCVLVGWVTFLHIISILRVDMNEIILKGLCIKRSKIAQNKFHGILPAHFYLLFTSSILPTKW